MRMLAIRRLFWYYRKEYWDAWHISRECLFGRFDDYPEPYPMKEWCDK